MNTLINICGLLISVSTLPDPVLSSYYQKYYNCPLITVNNPNLTVNSDIQQIPEQFPTEKNLWPIFTIDQIDSKNFNTMIKQGIKPGLLLPENFMHPLIYFRIKKEVDKGAIPILDLSTVEPARFNGLATLATSVGLRPMGAYVAGGWNPLLKVLPAGLYIVQANAGQIPLPARPIQSQKQLFYSAYTHSYGFNGTGILLNPQGNILPQDLHYPKLGISWKFLNIQFDSQPDQIHTNLIGHLLLFAGLLIIPLHFILSTHYPELLKIWGTSTSWLLVFVIIILMFILITTMLWRKFKK